VVGGLVAFIAKTQAGQEIARTYHIKLFQPEKPPPPPKQEEKPPPPPPPKVDQPKAPEPMVARVPAAAAAPAAQIGGGGGAGGAGVNWNSGNFASGFDGPEGAFNAAVTASFRKYYKDPRENFGPAQLQLVVSETGHVVSYRLVNSSGNAANDRAILAAAEQVKSEGVATPRKGDPKGNDRVVTIRFTPY
jgi:protein TonB